MKPSQWRCMTQSERPNLSIVDEATVLSGGSHTYARGEEMPAPLSWVEAGQRRQIADALTAIMVQAESVRRNSAGSQANEAAVASSCEHIVECAKRAWSLLAEPATLA